MSEQRHRYDLERQIRELTAELAGAYKRIDQLNAHHEQALLESESALAERDKLLDELIAWREGLGTCVIGEMIDKAAALRGKI